MKKRLEQKRSQRLIYNKTVLNDLSAGLGVNGFDKIKTFKDLVSYKFIENLKLKKGEKVLDLGCNAGELLNKIVASYQVEGYGVDISDHTIAIAKKHNPHNNHYRVGDAENLPYEDNYFDAVVSTDVLEHVPHPKKVLAEIARVLKPNGRFYIYCISKRNFLTCGWFMQKLRYKHAWGDIGDHRKELLVAPEIFMKNSPLKASKIYFFDCFFMHFFDEFLIRPFLALVASGRMRSGRSNKALVAGRREYPVRPKGSARVYLFFLTIFFYFTLILDTPWRIFKMSNAILVRGQKAGNQT